MIPLRTNPNRFIPPAVNRRQMGNNFGMNQQLPTGLLPQQLQQLQQLQLQQQQPQPRIPFQPPQLPQGLLNTQQQQLPPEQPQVDFAKEYGKIQSNRPNRLAYQRAVEQGAPQIERGKWAKLGAAIAAGGAALGGTRAPDAANLGISAYMQPQERADINYDKRIKGLSQLAGIEQEDVAAAIKALEMQQSDYYKRREDIRQQQQEERAGKLTAAQIENIRDEMNLRGTDTWEDEKTGISYKRDRKGTITTIGKTGLTTEEKAAAKGLETKATEKELEPGRRARDIADLTQAERVANIAAGSREKVAQENNQARIDITVAKLRESAQRADPSKVAGTIMNDLADEIAAQRLPPEAAGYLKFDENGTPTADAGWFGSSTIEQQVREFIGKSITKSKTPTPVVGGRSAGAGPVSNINSGTTTSGGNWTARELP
jgi:transcriptional regulator with XRE-family HTH domain